MPLRNHTNIIPFPLTTGGQSRTFAKGQPMSWLLSNLPKLSGNGTKVNVLLGFMVTVIGSYTAMTDPGPACYPSGFRNPGSAGGRSQIRTMWDTIRSLIESVELRSAWHGTPISSGHVKGSMLQLLEFVGNGLETPIRQRPPLVAGSGATRYFRYSFFLPTSLLAGRKGHHTALPAALYQDAELVINGRATLSPFGGTDEEDTLGTTTFQVSALLLPSSEIVMGPGLEWIDYRQAVSGDAFDIPGLGTVTTLDRVKPSAGIAGLFYLSNRNGLPGPGMIRDIAGLSAPFLDINFTTHLDPLVRQFEAAIGGCVAPLGPVTAALDGDGDPGEGATAYCGFPYDDFDKGTSAEGAAHINAQLPPNPMVLALKVPPRDFETSKLTRGTGTEQVTIMQRVGGAAFAGAHHVLALQLRAWTPEAWASATQKLIESGVTRAILNTSDVEWSMKTLDNSNPLTIPVEQREFFPLILKAKSSAAVEVR